MKKNLMNKRIVKEIAKIKNDPVKSRHGYIRVAADINKKFNTNLSAKEIREYWRNQFYSKQKGTKEFLADIEKKELNELRSKKTFYETIGKSLISATEKLTPSLKRPKPAKHKKHTEEMVLLISDLHAGLKVVAEESGGLGAFDTTILSEEIDFYMQALQRIFNIHFKETRYDVCNIFLLGDLIEGRILRESQLRLTDLAVVEQVMYALDKLTKIIAWLASQFLEINIFGISGNHTRLTQKIGVLSPYDTLDYLIMQWMKERLSNLKNVNFTISKSWWMIVERLGQKFYLEHGEDFYSWMGIPFYGMKRGKANVRELMRQYLDEKGRLVDFTHFVVAHIHQPSEFSNIISNGSWCGATEYSLKRLKTGCPPIQKIFGIHHKYGKTWSRDIALKDITKQIVKIYS